MHAQAGPVGDLISNRQDHQQVPTGYFSSLAAQVIQHRQNRRKYAGAGVTLDFGITVVRVDGVDCKRTGHRGAHGADGLS